MLNKKSLFNFVYAIALVGAILSCVGILNEFLNIAQLYGVNITNTAEIVKDGYFKPFIFYLLAFLISGFAVTMLVLHLLGKLKYSKKTVDIILLSACAALLLLSFILVFVLRKYSSFSDKYFIGYFNYLVYYTFRSGVMSFVANMGILLLCHLVEAKSEKAEPEASLEEK